MEHPDSSMHSSHQTPSAPSMTSDTMPGSKNTKTRNTWQMMVLSTALLVVLVIAGSRALDVFKAQRIRQELSLAKYVPSQISKASDCAVRTQLGTSPLAVNDLEYIVPMGRMGDAHVVPTDHQYWIPKTVSSDTNLTESPFTYSIYAPADGTITQVEHLTQPVAEKRGIEHVINDYNIVIEHECLVSSVLTHVDVLNDQIMASLSAPASVTDGATVYTVRIPVNQGELLGKLRQHSFDFSVRDETVMLPGFINLARYEQKEPWKLHTVDPFEYFKEPVKSQLLAKVVRAGLPMGGKIDYDVEGKLVGNWYRTGTTGTMEERSDGRFWDGQLAIAPDHFDPTRILVSVGNYNGSAWQFAVKGNTPDPRNVGVSNGIVAYELVPFYYVDKDGNFWKQRSYASGVRLVEGEEVQATVLFQLTFNKKLTVEFFPGKTATDVLRFDPKYQVYER